LAARAVWLLAANVGLWPQKTGRLFVGDCFEEGVAEGAVGGGGSVEVLDALVEGFGGDEVGGEGVVADGGDHGGEGLFREAVDEGGAACVDVDHAGGDAGGGEAGFLEERVKLAADVGVAAGAALEFDLAADGGVGGGAVGVEVRRAVVAFDDGDRAVGLEVGLEDAEGVDRAGEMLKDEADEDVVERLRLERQVEDVGLLELDVPEPRGRDLAFRLRQ